MILSPVLKYIAGGLGAIALMLGLALHFERKGHEKTRLQNAALQAELQRITTARDEQGKTSTRTVERVVKGDPVIIRQVERVEAAPLPGQCRTPEAILGADL